MRTSKRYKTTSPELIRITITKYRTPNFANLLRIKYFHNWVILTKRKKNLKKCWETTIYLDMDPSQLKLSKQYCKSMEWRSLLMNFKLLLDRWIRRENRWGLISFYLLSDSQPYTIARWRLSYIKSACAKRCSWNRFKKSFKTFLLASC